jgi:hypothetical protein
MDGKHRNLKSRRLQVRKIGESKVGRWFIYKLKIPFWVNFRGSCKGRCWNMLWPFGQFLGHLVNVFCGHLVYFPVLVCCTMKNSVTLGESAEGTYVLPTSYK